MNIGITMRTNMGWFFYPMPYANILDNFVDIYMYD